MRNQSIAGRYRGSQAAADGHGRSHAASVPKELTWVLLGLAALVILHVVIPMVILVERDAIADGVRQANGALGPEMVDTIVKVTLIASVVYHLLFAGLFVWLGLKLRLGRRWARVALSVALVLATLSSVTSYKSSPMFRAVIPVADVLQLVLIAGDHSVFMPLPGPGSLFGVTFRLSSVEICYRVSATGTYINTTTLIYSQPNNPLLGPLNETDHGSLTFECYTLNDPATSTMVGSPAVRLSLHFALGNDTVALSRITATYARIP